MSLPRPEAAVAGKYKEIMNPRVGEEKAERIYSVLLALDTVKQVSELSELLA